MLLGLALLVMGLPAAENGTKYHYRVTTVNPEDEESSPSGEITRAPLRSPIVRRGDAHPIRMVVETCFSRFPMFHF